MDTRGAVDLGQIASVRTFKKGKQPSLGPAFSTDPFLHSSMLTLPGGASLMVDLDKLTLADFRVMRHHPQINAALSLITFMIHQLDWTIQCEDSKIANAVEENMRLIWTRLVRAISQSFWAGFSPSVLEWENESSGRYTFITKIKDLIPEECQVSWLEVEASYRPPEQNIIVPKVKVFNGMKKLGLGYDIPPLHTFWYPLLMENGNYYGKQLLKPAFTSWYFSLLMHLFANRYFERFGEPLPIGRAPFDVEFPFKDADGTDRSQTGKQVMDNMLRTLRNRGHVVLPSDRDDTASGQGGRSEYLFDIEYLESQMRGADFERYMERLDEEISLSIFTPMLLLRTGQVGSNALGVQHTQTWLWSLNALAGDIKEFIDRYICQRIKEINFSPNAPRVEWVPKKMGKENPETLRSIISAMISGKLVQPNIEELGTALGMTLEEITEADVLRSQGGPKEEPAGPGGDTRDRAIRVRTNDKPPSVGETLAAGRKIAARINGQITKDWQAFAKAPRPLSMGYRRVFRQSLIDGGWTEDQADAMTDKFYGRMEGWLERTSQYVDEFAQADDFMDLLQRRMTQEIEDLAAA